MTIPGRIKERGIRNLIIILLLVALAAYSYSAKAQGIKATQSNAFDPENLVSNATKTIHLASNLNAEARAVPLRASINSPYAELKPMLSPDGSRLYFSRSFHPGNTSAVADAEDIWYSNFNKTSDTWSDPVLMTAPLNNGGPNYINNVSMTGDTLILGNQYGKKGKMRAGISYSVNVEGQWSAPVSIDILNDYNMSEHAKSFVSLKSGIIIRAIQRGETYGQRDLYVSFWDGVQATEPINMGTVINTAFEESSPFLAADNKTLYFASKGHAGYGGYDIFVTHRLDDSWVNWSAPENLGPAVNGDLDDEFFSLSLCGKNATFSKQVSVHNVDLFKISIEELFGQPASQMSTSSFASL
jgi:hypothetical protein